MSHEGFPFATCGTIEVGSLRVLASRISYVGDLGWELYVPIEQGARLWDVVAEAGEPHGVVPAGIGVYGTTGRMEKCYRAFGFELDGEYDVVEAGMAWGKVKDAGLRRQGGARAPARVRAGRGDVHADGRRPHVGDGRRRYMLGGEPILTRDGAPLVDAKGRRRSSRAPAPGPSVGKYILMAYLPPEHAVVGEQLAVLYMGERYPVTVAVAGSTPLFDPENERGSGACCMNILVCVKRVPLTGGKIVLTADARRSRRATSASRSARTRSAASRRRCGSSSARRRGRPCSRSGRPRRRSRSATPGDRRDRGILLETDGEEWDAQATAAAIVGREARARALRPDRLRQRVGRRRQLPGRHPRRVRARAPGRRPG